MKVFNLNRNEKSAKEFRHKDASAQKGSLVINEDAEIKVSGKTIGYFVKNFASSDFGYLLNKAKYDAGTRASGVPTNSSCFHFCPRHVLRADYCRISKFSHDNPKLYKMLNDLGAKVANKYKEVDKEVYSLHDKKVKETIREEYLIPNTPFTGGIVNKNNKLKYHTDGGNVSGVWSCMLVFKKDVIGGDLHIPMYDTTLRLDDGDLVMFDGQGTMHGVTPFKATSPFFYRYTVVYYSLKAMKECLPYKDEMERYKKKRTEIELDYKKERLKSQLKK